MLDVVTTFNKDSLIVKPSVYLKMKDNDNKISINIVFSKPVYLAN